MARPAVLAVWLVGISALVARADTLEERLTALARAHRGTVAIAVKNLDSSESVFINADEVLPTASLIKFPVMLEVYMQALEGKVKLGDMVTLKETDKVTGSGILTYHFSEGATFSLRDAVRLTLKRVINCVDTSCFLNQRERPQRLGSA